MQEKSCSADSEMGVKNNCSKNADQLSDFQMPQIFIVPGTVKKRSFSLGQLAIRPTDSREGLWTNDETKVKDESRYLN